MAVRPCPGPGAGLQVRLASGENELRAAQHLRWRAFYLERGLAVPPPAGADDGIDADALDALCDHLLVVHRETPGAAPVVVGTYRLLRGSVARSHGRSATAGSFDLGCLHGHGGEWLEVGRACVDRGHRNGAVLQLLWRGITEYLLRHRIELLFGRASFDGSDPARHAAALAYLYRNHLAPRQLRVRAHNALRVEMQSYDADDVRPLDALRLLPPLIKGYLRLGAWVGDGAVIDTAMDQLDVCVLLQTRQMSARYLRHYLQRGSIQVRTERAA